MAYLSRTLVRIVAQDEQSVTFFAHGRGDCITMQRSELPDWMVETSTDTRFFAVTNLDVDDDIDENGKPFGISAWENSTKFVPNFKPLYDTR